MINLFKKLFRSGDSSNNVVDANAYSERTKYAKKERTLLNSIRDISTARQRIRAEYLNNFSMAAAINSVSRLAVGTKGITVVFSPLKKSNRQSNLRNRVQEEFSKWANSTVCDSERSSNLMNVQLMIANTVRLDGFVFFEVVRDTEGIYIKTHSADRLADTLHKDLDNGNFIRFGVEYNPQMIKVAYHLRSGDELKRYLYSGGIVESDYWETERFPVERMTMCYLPDRAGMPFGLPSMLSTFLVGRSIKTYQDAEIQKQSIASAIVGFATSDLPEDDVPFLDIQKESRNNVVGERDKQRNVDVLDFPISTIERLRDGESVTFPNPPDTENYAQFMDSNLGSIAMGQGITREFFMGDFSKASYSSSRMAASINALPTSALRGNVLQAQLLNKVVKEFVDHLYLAKDFPVDVLKMPWDYLCAAMPAVDPVKQAKADEIDFNIGVKSLTTIMTDRGLSPEKEFERIISERERYPDLFKRLDETRPAMGEGIEENQQEDN